MNQLLKKVSMKIKLIITTINRGYIKQKDLKYDISKYDMEREIKM